MNRYLLVCLLCVLGLSGGTNALSLGEVAIADAIEADATTPRLVLNGAGIRKKFFVGVYVAALYLPKREADPKALLAAPPPNRVTMHFVHSRVDKRKLDEAWRDGFGNNLRPEQLTPLADRLVRFIALFGDMHKGDTVVLDYRPGSGTSVTINDELRGRIEGADFNAGLLSVWLGHKPVTEGLKNDLLGVDN